MACAGGSGEYCPICIIWMTLFDGFSSNPWMLLAELGLKYLAHLYTICASGGFVNHMRRLLYTDDNGSPSLKRLSPTLLQRFDSSDEQRRLTMCCQRCCSAKLKSSNEWTLHNLLSWLEYANIVSCADCRVPTHLKTSYLADNTLGSTLKVFFIRLLLSFCIKFHFFYNVHSMWSCWTLHNYAMWHKASFDSPTKSQ